MDNRMDRRVIGAAGARALAVAAAAAPVHTNTETGEPPSPEASAEVQQKIDAHAESMRAKPLSPSERRMRERREGRVLAGMDFDGKLPKGKGYQMRAVEGSSYVCREGEPFVRRVGKIKGKAAKKAAKRQRQYDGDGRRIL